MNARKHADLDGDLANLVEGAMVGPDAVVQHLFAEDVLAQKLIILAELFRSSGIPFRQLLFQLVLYRLDQGVAFELRVLLRIERIGETAADLGF